MGACENGVVRNQEKSVTFTANNLERAQKSI